MTLSVGRRESKSKTALSKKAEEYSLQIFAHEVHNAFYRLMLYHGNDDDSVRTKFSDIYDEEQSDQRTRAANEFQAIHAFGDCFNVKYQNSKLHKKLPPLPDWFPRGLSYRNPIKVVVEAVTTAGEDRRIKKDFTHAALMNLSNQIIELQLTSRRVPMEFGNLYPMIAKSINIRSSKNTALVLFLFWKATPPHPFPSGTSSLLDVAELLEIHSSKLKQGVSRKPDFLTAFIDDKYPLLRLKGWMCFMDKIPKHKELKMNFGRNVAEMTKLVSEKKYLLFLSKSPDEGIAVHIPTKTFHWQNGAVHVIEQKGLQYALEGRLMRDAWILSFLEPSSLA